VHESVVAHRAAEPGCRLSRRVSEGNRTIGEHREIDVNDPQRSSGRIPGTGFYGISVEADHSGLMLAARTTLAHFSVSSAMSLPKSAGEP
jgi:hypothetical protein